MEDQLEAPLCFQGNTLYLCLTWYFANDIDVIMTTYVYR